MTRTIGYSSRIYAVGHCGFNLEGDKLSDKPTLLAALNKSF